MRQLHYFAYGSNMSVPRLKARVPSARVIGCYTLPLHELRMHKVGRDGSAKADAYVTNNPYHRVYGVLYEIDEDEKIFLDQAEGLGNGYEEKTVVLYGRGGERVKGFLYYATHIDSALLPFSWYMHHIVSGAASAGLPESYICKIRALQAMADHDKKRETEELFLYKRVSH